MAFHNFLTSRYPGRAEIVGYRDSEGRWNYQNPRNRNWYIGEEGEGARARTRGTAPRPEDLERGGLVSVKVRHRGETYHYSYKTPARLPVTGKRVEADFRAKFKAGRAKRYGKQGRKRVV